MKKRLDQARADVRTMEEKLTEIRKSILALATEVEMLGVEAGHIVRRNATHPDSPDYGSANRILASAHRIIDVVLKLTKSDSAKND